MAVFHTVNKSCHVSKDILHVCFPKEISWVSKAVSVKRRLQTEFSGFLEEKLWVSVRMPTQAAQTLFVIYIRDSIVLRFEPF